QNEQYLEQWNTAQDDEHLYVEAQFQQIAAESVITPSTSPYEEARERRRRLAEAVY
ncbi:hypothetical protein HK096_001962, partial [Nowakowskiella sp. JEL0078]